MHSAAIELAATSRQGKLTEGHITWTWKRQPSLPKRCGLAHFSTDKEMSALGQTLTSLRPIAWSASCQKRTWRYGQKAGLLIELFVTIVVRRFDQEYGVTFARVKGLELKGY